MADNPSWQLVTTLLYDWANLANSRNTQTLRIASPSAIIHYCELLAKELDNDRAANLLRTEGMLRFTERLTKGETLASIEARLVPFKGVSQKDNNIIVNYIERLKVILEQFLQDEFLENHLKEMSFSDVRMFLSTCKSLYGTIDSKVIQLRAGNYIWTSISEVEYLMKIVDELSKIEMLLLPISLMKGVLDTIREVHLFFNELLIFDFLNYVKNKVAKGQVDEDKEELRKFFISKREELLSSLHVFADSTSKNDQVSPGESFSIWAGIFQSDVEKINRYSFLKIYQDDINTFSFDISIKTNNHVEILQDWSKPLLYNVLDSTPQKIDFSIRAKSIGDALVILDFYFNRQWLTTIRIEFGVMEKSRRFEEQIESPSAQLHTGRSHHEHAYR